MWAGLTKMLAFVFTMLVYVTLGYVGRGSKVLDDKALDGGNQILASLLLPASILTAARADTPAGDTLKSVGLFIFVTLISYAIHFAAAHLLAGRMGLDRNMEANFVGASVLKNIGYLGLPMCLAVLGDESGFYVGFSMIIFTVIAWTYGIYMYSGERSFHFKKVFLNNSMLVCYLTILIRVLQIHLPGFVWDTVSALGSACTPLSLILIGYTLHQAGLSTIFRGKLLFVASFYCLVVTPLVTLGLVLLLKVPVDAAAVLIVLAAVPSATINAVFAKTYGDGGETASAAVLQQILLSMITMPVLMTILFRIIHYGF